MTGIFAKPNNVLSLAGIALADLAVLVSAQQYVPTLHLSKTSFWSGTKIDQIRFGSYPDVGLIELARAEVVRRSESLDNWAFGCVAALPTDQEKLVLRVEAGEAQLSKIVLIIQEFHLPRESFGLRGRPRFSLLIPGDVLALDEATATSWEGFLHNGISKLKTARDNWEQWSAPPVDQAATVAR